MLSAANNTAKTTIVDVMAKQKRKSKLSIYFLFYLCLKKDSK